jgi:hypothetical protein
MRVGQAQREGDVKRLAEEVLAVFGHPKPLSRQLGVRLGRTEGGEHGCLSLSHGFHDVGQEIERGDIHRANLVGVMVT